MKQHFVPVSYLKPWCDPLTPQGQKPYVWVSTRDGKKFVKKAPKNILRHSDFYTILDEQGNKNQSLEYHLHSIEDGFLKARNVLKNHGTLNEVNFLSLVMFMITAFARTEQQKSDQSKIWEEQLDILHLSSNLKHAPAPYQQIEQLRDQPMPFFLSNLVRIALPVLSRMNLTVYETSREDGFVTSDNPIIWIDQSMFLPDYALTFFGLGSSTLKILLPMSPKQMVTLTWSDREGYHFVDSQPQMIDEFNKIMIYWSSVTPRATIHQ